jgi:hypothetical protein
MRKYRPFGYALFVLAIAAAMTATTIYLLPDAEAKPPKPPGGCFCPMVYAPVLCDNGVTYSNQCVADCHNAHNCVPVGPGPVPL